MTLAAARAARLRSRRRQRALAPRRAADHRRGHRAEGHAPGAARRSAGAGDRVRGGRGRLLRLDAGLGADHPRGRARPLVRAVRGLPRAARGAGAPARLAESLAMSDSYAAAGVDTGQADRAVDALVGVLRTIEPGRPSASVAAQRPLRRRAARGAATSGSRSRPTASARSSSSPSRPAASTRSGIDCVAMNVNDLVCVGAEPIAMLDYLAVEQADPDGAGARSRTG